MLSRDESHCLASIAINPPIILLHTEKSDPWVVFTPYFVYASEIYRLANKLPLVEEINVCVRFRTKLINELLA